jgi:hypothetical protein
MAKLSTSNIGARKNLILNGDMGIDQKESSPWTGRGNGDAGWYIDMWEFSETGAIVGVVTISQDTGLQDATYPFDTALKWDCTVAETYTDTSSYMQIIHRIEAQDLQHLQYGTANAKDLTLSFYTKGNKAGTMCICLTAPDGTRQYVAEVSITGDGNWERKEVTVPGDTSGTINNDNGAGLIVRWSMTAGSGKQAAAADVWAADTGSDATSNQTNFLDNTANDFWLGGVQLEVGSVATEFEYRPRAEELALVQRYYFRILHVTGDTSVGSGMSRTTTVGWSYFQYPVPMRDIPTVTFQGTPSNFSLYHGGSTTACTATGHGDIDKHGVVLQGTVASGLTIGEGLVMKINLSAGWIEFDAYL